MTSTLPPRAFDVKLTFQGRSATLSDITNVTTAKDLHEKSVALFGLSDMAVKLLHKGRVLSKDGPNSPAFPDGIKGKSVKVLVMATNHQKVTDLNTGRSDPTVRGFDDEKKPQENRGPFWGPAASAQHRQFKFVKFEACTWQSFGHRTGSKTPHAFRALEILERLATDPGIVAVMEGRELVVNTLGEMDPVDDRLMQKKKTEDGLCLLGYNTNHGLRIDIKLRTDDLNGFLPYEDIAATLLHELSHNWVGEHNALFWTNYGQMRVEYMHRHASLAASGYYVGGRTTAAIAGVAEQCRDGMESVSGSVVAEISKEATQHGVPVQMVAPSVLQRCRELTVESAGSGRGQKLGGNTAVPEESGGGKASSARELALAAAERRARAEKERQEKEKDNDRL